MLPNYLWKYISGWSNDSGKVITHEIERNEMGNRGSKSDVKSLCNKIQRPISSSVKEQRVDGSWLFSSFCAKQ
jgi:hypothetical protein